MMTEQIADWGQTDDGRNVSLFVLENEQLKVSLTNMGASLVSLEAPDRNGNLGPVVVSAGSCEGYVRNPSYLGATVGRFANRIGQGKFWLEGTEFTLAVNNGPNHLHGGLQGFSHKLWEAEPADDSVTFRYTSPDGEEGYPAAVTVAVTYRLDGKSLTIDYSARSEAATIINLTNHTYWNLGSQGSILDHVLQLYCGQYLENDENTLPTGTILDVSGTAYDFREPHAIGTRIQQTPGGYDNCFVIQDWDSTLRLVARVTDPASGRMMEVLTTEPGVQLYTANHFDGSPDSAGFRQHEAFCLECQHFPDSPNQIEFPSTALRPGEEYRQTTVHRFDVTDE